jgi:hypothetical protein
MPATEQRQDQPAEQGSMTAGAEDFDKTEKENSEETPDWLLDLESRAIDQPIEVLPQERYDAEYYPKGASTREPEEDLPDWLREDQTHQRRQTTAEASQAPEDELPEWLKKGIEELSTPADEEEPSFERDSARQGQPEAETLEMRRSSQAATEETGKKRLLRGLFGSKKDEKSEETVFSDEEIKRRLRLIALDAELEEEDAELEEGETSQTRDTFVEDKFESSPSFIKAPETALSYPPETSQSGQIQEEQTLGTDFTEINESADAQEELPQFVFDLTEEVLPEGELSEISPKTEPEEAGPAIDGYTELRELALQDYVEIPQQPEGGSVSNFFNKTIHQIASLSTIQKIFLASLLFVDMGLVALLVIVLIFSSFFFRSGLVAVGVPEASTVAVSPIDMPYPIRVTLPGGWFFDLKPGTLQDGVWSNQGPEWLQGTEITRWIALPWNKQLEAVVVTLTPTDQIEVLMSNQDRLNYRVETVLEVPVDKVSELNLNTPSLLLILSKKDSEARVVVVGSLIPDR